MKVAKIISNKDKQRIDAIYAEIESNEVKTKIIAEKISNLDYTKLADPNNAEVKILTEAQNVLEGRQAALYQELEQLES